MARTAASLVLVCLLAAAAAALVLTYPDADAAKKPGTGDPDAPIQGRLSRTSKAS